MMPVMNHKYVYTTVIIIVLGLALFLVRGVGKAVLPGDITHQATSTPDAVAVSTLQDGVYTNTKYAFKINLPDDWMYSESEGWDPVIIFSKKATSTATSSRPGRDNRPYVEVRPQGVSKDRVPFGNYEPTTLSFSEEVDSSYEYPLTNGMIWGTQVSFKNTPDSWTDAGYVFGWNPITNEEQECRQNGKSIEMSRCDFFEGMVIFRSGQVDQKERAEVESIVTSFEFLR